MRRCERRCEDEKVRRWEDEIQTPTIGRTLRSDALGNKMFSTWLLQNWWLLNGTLPNPPFLDQAVCMHQWNPQLLMVKSAKTTFLLFKFKSSMVLDTTNPPQVFSVPPWYQSSFLRGVLQLLMVRSMAKEGVAGSARVLSNQLMFTFRKHRAGGCS